MTHCNPPSMSTKQLLTSTNTLPSFRKYLRHVPKTCLPSRASSLSPDTMLASVSMRARISWAGRFSKSQIIIPRAQTINNNSPATIVTARHSTSSSASSAPALALYLSIPSTKFNHEPGKQSISNNQSRNTGYGEATAGPSSFSCVDS